MTDDRTKYRTRYYEVIRVDSGWQVIDNVVWRSKVVPDEGSARLMYDTLTKYNNWLGYPELYDLP